MSSGFSTNGATPNTGLLSAATNYNPNPNPTPPAIPITPPPAHNPPSTPVVSQTTTDSQGNTHKTTYAPADPKSAFSLSGLGAVGSNMGTGNQTSTPSATITPGMITKSNETLNAGKYGYDAYGRPLPAGLASIIGATGSTNASGTNTGLLGGSSGTTGTAPITTSGGLTADQIKANLSNGGFLNSSGTVNSTPTGTISQQQALAAQQQYATDQANTEANTPDPNSQQGLINAAQAANTKAQNFQAGLTTQENQEQYNPNNTGQVGTLGAGLLQATQGAQATALSNVAANDAALAGLKAPVSQFGVLTNPQTGQPITPGTTAGGAAFTGGVQQGLNSAGQNYANQYIASQGATGVKNTLDDFIKSNPNINTSTLTAGNTLTQWLNGKQLGDANTQTFLDDVSEYVQTLAPVLGVGGTPTDAKAYTAQQFVNAQASGQNVQQVLNNIEALANNKLSSIYAAGTGGTAPAITSQTGGTSGGGTPTSFGQSW